jgi:hypothetical protein
MGQGKALLMKWLQDSNQTNWQISPDSTASGLNFLATTPSKKSSALHLILITGATACSVTG